MPSIAIANHPERNIIRALEVMEKELSDGRPFLTGDEVTMADYFLLPTMFAFVLTPVAAFAHDPAELEAVAELLDSAKAEAIKRWYSLRSEAIAS